MILKGSQRGGARQLAAHLMKDENEHVTVIELKGFMADDLGGAFDEAHAVAKGTKCQQFLFSLSLNPPSDRAVGDETFRKAADDIEARLGLEGQPRAIVIHEKEGRRHAHAVWSRIDAETMTARPLPFFKNKLRDLSREIYLEHGWPMPDGLRDPLLKNPLNFTREEWQQAQRSQRDPREIKQVVQQAWLQADGAKAFGAALREHGLLLARGDRRGHGVVDHNGEFIPLARALSVKTKEVKARLGDPKLLPSIEVAKTEFRDAMLPRLQEYRDDLRSAHREERRELKQRRTVLVDQHRKQREELRDLHDQRNAAETRARAERIRGGLLGIWDLLRGKKRKILEANEREAWDALRRDQKERDILIVRQLRERRALQSEIEELRDRQREERASFQMDVGRYLKARDLAHEWDERDRQRGREGPDRSSGFER